jgi:hypothetical protein
MDDLDPKVQFNLKSGEIRCFVQGCQHWVEPPSRKQRSGRPCPDHDIYCHRSGTYRHADFQNNLIADPEFFARELRGHPAKYEAHRFGSENSEDALTWNVFRSFQNAGLLHRLAGLATDRKVTEEPELYLWGIKIDKDSVAPGIMPGLQDARKRFESNLPVDRPLTEPDIMLYEPGDFLVLIEAKFTSPNGIYIRGSKTKQGDLTLDQLLSIYRDPESTLIDYPMACSRDRIAYQLYRNTMFSEWMAREDGCRTEPYHANLVRNGRETDSAAEFHSLFRPEYQDRFRQITWEQIYKIASQDSPKLSRLCRYMETKTARLSPAFDMARIPMGANPLPAGGP